jgi:ankyrin repeat protein
MESPQTTVAGVLASVSDVLFPADFGERPVTLNSRGAGGDTPLHVLAWRRDAAGAAVLIAAGADVNAAGDMDETPLHVALRQRDRSMAELLVRAGARADIRSEFGETAAELAARENMADWLTG